MTTLKKKKIIWAVDPYGEANVQASAAALAKSLNQYSDLEVIYVHGRSGFHLETKKEAIRFGLSHAENQLRKFLGQLKFKPNKKPQILAHDSDSVRSHVNTLVSFAKKIEADAVLVSTNARTGFLRKILGSFSETLILASAIPTLIVNPHAKVAAQPGTILFPTDFSDLSWKAFQQVVSFAEATNAKVRIFHQYLGEPQTVPPNTSYFHHDLWLEGDRLLDEELQKIKSKLPAWLMLAKNKNVNCDYVIKFGRKNIADATLAIAKKENVWMIAMATVTGPIAAGFLGSDARWIVRSASCPVWVLYIHKHK